MQIALKRAWYIRKLAEFSKNWMEYSEKLRNSSEKLKTQAKNSKTQAKNSRFRQIHLVYLPKIGRIKKPGLRGSHDRWIILRASTLLQWKLHFRTSGSFLTNPGTSEYGKYSGSKDLRSVRMDAPWALCLIVMGFLKGPLRVFDL